MSLQVVLVSPVDLISHADATVKSVQPFLPGGEFDLACGSWSLNTGFGFGTAGPGSGCRSRVHDLISWFYNLYFCVSAHRATNQPPGVIIRCCLEIFSTLSTQRRRRTDRLYCKSSDSVHTRVVRDVVNRGGSPEPTPMGKFGPAGSGSLPGSPHIFRHISASKRKHPGLEWQPRCRLPASQ